VLSSCASIELLLRPTTEAPHARIVHATAALLSKVIRVEPTHCDQAELYPTVLGGGAASRGDACPPTNTLRGTTSRSASGSSMRVVKTGAAGAVSQLSLVTCRPSNQAA
jgi:hypothetical protein